MPTEKPMERQNKKIKLIFSNRSTQLELVGFAGLAVASTIPFGTRWIGGCGGGSSGAA